MGQLLELKILNVSDNAIKHLPAELGSCLTLRSLFIHGNRFHSFPCSFMNLTALQEFSLEWFIYAKPVRAKFVKRNVSDGQDTFESLIVLCQLL